MRYFLLALVMLGDIAIPATVTILLYIIYQLSPLFFLAAFFIVVVAFEGHQKMGGFENWRPSQIKKYLANARKIGL